MRGSSFPLVTAGLSAGLLLLVASAAGAQQSQPPAQGQGNPCMAGAMRDLGLTDEQKAKIKQIRDTTQPGEERRKAIEAVLTQEQRDKLAAARAACQQQGH
jgi:Spy/CpxP family protein refolding chaperone